MLLTWPLLPRHPCGNGSRKGPFSPHGCFVQLPNVQERDHRITGESHALPEIIAGLHTCSVARYHMQALAGKTGLLSTGLERQNG